MGAARTLVSEGSKCELASSGTFHDLLAHPRQLLAQGRDDKLARSDADGGRGRPARARATSDGDPPPPRARGGSAWQGAQASNLAVSSAVTCFGSAFGSTQSFHAYSSRFWEYSARLRALPKSDCGAGSIRAGVRPVAEAVAEAAAPNCGAPGRAHRTPPTSHPLRPRCRAHQRVPRGRLVQGVQALLRHVLQSALRTPEFAEVGRHGQLKLALDPRPSLPPSLGALPSAARAHDARVAWQWRAVRASIPVPRWLPRG